MNDEAEPSSPEALLRWASAESATPRELLTAVAADLERPASEHPEHAARFLARAPRLRRRLREAGS